MEKYEKLLSQYAKEQRAKKHAATAEPPKPVVVATQMPVKAPATAKPATAPKVVPKK